MAYGTKYKLEWSTNAGSDIEWRLDVEQEGYSGTIQDVVGSEEPAVLKYIGHNDIYSPVIASKLTIQLYTTDDDTYDDFTALQDADGTLDARAYRVNLRWRNPGDTNYNLYWRGFVSPQDTKVVYNTNPYMIELIATDGINLIADTQLAPFANEDPDDQTKVGDYILDALVETGTQLDVRCYHDIKTDISGSESYAIMDTETSDYVYFDENYFATKNKVEAMEDVLKSFNARIFQSDGAWCIISNSNHGAGDDDSVSYLNYTYDSSNDEYDKGSESTGNDLLKQFPNDLIPALGDMDTEHRRPLFSFERNISSQKGLPISTNSFFSSAVGTVDDTPGPVWINKIIKGGAAAPYGTTRTAHEDGAVDARGSHYVSTTGLNQNNGRDIWFESNIDMTDVYDWEKVATVISRVSSSSTDVSRVEIGVSLAAQIHNDDGTTDWYVYNFDESEWDWRDFNRKTNKSQYWNYIVTTSEDFDVWRSESVGDTLDVGRAQSGFSRFIRNLGRNLIDSSGTIGLLSSLASLTGIGLIASAVKVIKGYQLYDAIQQTRDGIGDNLTFKIRIGDIKAYNNDGDRDDDATVQVDIDAVVLEYETETANPFFERYQSSFSETKGDTVGLVSRGTSATPIPAIYRGSLSQDEYYRVGKSETLSLEQLVTLQKLNDYRVPLKFYEGTLIPKTGVLNLVDRVQQNFGNSEADSHSCTQQHFEFRVKSNQYTSKMYLRNQDESDEGTYSTFGDKDVYPALANYTWRDTRINHDIKLDLSSITLPSTGGIETALDGAVSAGATSITVDSTTGFPSSGWLVIGDNEVRYTGKTATTFTGIPATGEGATTAEADNAEVVAGVSAYINTGLTPYLNADSEPEYGQYFIRYEDVEGDEIRRTTINLEPSDNNSWEINASNFSINNASDISAEEIEIFDTGFGVRLTFDLETKQVSDEYLVTLGGEVDATSTGSVSFTVTKGTDPTNTTVSVADGGNLPAGSTEYVLVYVTPDDGYQITLANSSITATAYDSSDAVLTGVIGNIAELKSGLGVQYTIPVTHNANLDDIGVTVTATATTHSASLDTADLTLTISETGDNTSDFSLGDTSIGPITGVVGTDSDFVVEVNADPGKKITAIAVGSTEEDAVGTIRTKQISATEWLLFVNMTFQTTDATAAITVDATTADGDDDTVTHTFSFEDDDADTVNWSWTQTDADQAYNLVPTSQADFIFQIEPDSGYALPSDFTITSNQTWAAVGTPQYYYADNGDIELAEIPVKVTGQTSAASVTFTTSGTVAASNNRYIFRININSTDAFNATTSVNHIDILFSDADLGNPEDNSDNGWSFTLTSADPAMEYTAVTDLGSVESGNDTTLPDDGGNNDSTDNITWAYASNIITVSIDQVNFPSTAPVGGIYEVDLTLSDAAVTSSVDATTGSLSGVADNSVRANTGTTSFNVTANGAWKLQSYSAASLIPIDEALSDFSPNKGGSGTFTVVARPKVTLGSNGKQVASDGTDDNSGATSGTINVYLVAQSQTGSFNTTNLASDTYTWTAIGGADDNLVSSLDFNQAKVVTSIPASSDSDYDASTLYLKYDAS